MKMSGRLMAASPRPPGKTVLYVEDDPENWAVAELHLGRKFNLAWARTDAEACTYVRDHANDLCAILMDIELRGSQLSGVELSELIRGRMLERELPDFAKGIPELQLPIIFVTAYTARYSEGELMRAGGSRLIAKPVHFGELSLALSALRSLELGPASSQLVQLLNRPEVDFSEVSQFLATQPSLEAKLWSIPRMGGLDKVTPIRNLSEAVEELGLSGLRHCALWVAALEFVPFVETEGLCLVESALRRGVAASLVAKRLKNPAVPPVEAFTAGLLLESALLLRSQHDLAGAVAVLQSPSANRVAWERAAGEVDHAQRGGQLARDWNLGTDLETLIEHHHDTEPPPSPLARVAWLAERLAAVFEVGDHEQSLSVALSSAQVLDLSQADVEAILAALPDEMQKAAAGPGLQIPRQTPFRELLAYSNASLSRLSTSYDNLVRTLDSLLQEKDALLARVTAANERLHSYALTDELTGAPNLRGLLSALNRDFALAKRERTPLSFIMLDLDHFKRVNDTYGHAAGDEALRYATRVLQAGLRAGDLLARYGGEEFAVLVPRLAGRSAADIAERLRESLEQAVFSWQGHALPLTASFGVATLSRNFSLKPDALIRAADEALYQAKSQGRNRVVLAHPPL